MCEATSHYVVNRDNFNSESSRSKFAALLMVLGRARNVQDPEIYCGLLLNICVSFCSYHCFIYRYIYIYICVCVCGFHNSVKPFKISQHRNYSTDHGSSYADRERNSPLFTYFTDANCVNFW